MKLTWIDLNSWIFELGEQTILVDPWLVDPLIFYGQPWLFTAYHNTPISFTPQTLPPIDLILIAQGLDDHCHKPTLACLDRSIPVIAAPSAAQTLQALGYAQVTTLQSGQTVDLAGGIQITAVPGAPIQPGQIENGYLLRDRGNGASLYYEPHLFPGAAAVQHYIEQVDVAIAPVIGQIFPLLGQVIMGPEQTMALVKTLQPQFFLPTTLGDIRASGILPMLTRSVGSVEEFQALLHQSLLSTQLLHPVPGEAIEIDTIAGKTSRG
ncbi:MAG: MBL fold metallo-hydrolase [Scytolyngbya sp. HA4215-MV1]|nr:MBL fold metallo-hydrolase [Scytolyngbya sp. HA4215-MV1]